MAIWEELIGEYIVETTTFTALTGDDGKSPWTPTKSGTLKLLTIVFGRDAATTLIDHVIFRLTATTFDPNTMFVGGTGAGLQTAPALSAGATEKYIVNQKVTAGVPVTIAAKNATADTPVGVRVFLYATIEG